MKNESLHFFAPLKLFTYPFKLIKLIRQQNQTNKEKHTLINYKWHQWVVASAGSGPQLNIFQVGSSPNEAPAPASGSSLTLRTVSTGRAHVCRWDDVQVTMQRSLWWCFLSSLLLLSSPAWCLQMRDCFVSCPGDHAEVSLMMFSIILTPPLLSCMVSVDKGLLCVMSRWSCRGLSDIVFFAPLLHSSPLLYGVCTLQICDCFVWWPGNHGRGLSDVVFYQSRSSSPLPDRVCR